MRTIECTIDVDAPPAEVFDVLHDYDRRLEWDPFLRRAEILDGAGHPGRGVRTRCVSRGLGGLAMETVYLSFERPKVAAVRMTDGPFFLRDFAASLRQLELLNGRTRVSYKFRLCAWPRPLRWLLEPAFSRVFARETERRLRHLKRYVERAGAV